MKKALIIILSALVFLTSCTISVNKESNVGTIGSSEVQSPVDPNVFHLSSLPDIGEFSGINSGGRFYDEITYDFIPSDEYGMIVPYVASYRVFETPKEEGSDWHVEQGYASYGFCTLDGRIVMDASDTNSYVSYNETDDGFGFYTLSREVHVKDDAPDEFMPTEQLIIPKDGSWCLSLESDRMWLSVSGGGYLSVVEYPGNDSDEKVKTHFYDYNGNHVKTLDGIDSTGIYSCGLLMVSSWETNTYTTWFINEYGETVLGPYYSASDFNEFGITRVQDENGTFLINTEGEKLTDYYDSIFREYYSDSSKRLFSARRFGPEKIVDVFAPDGSLIGTIEGTSYVSFKFPDNGDILYYYTHYDENEKGYPIYNSERMIWKRLGDNTEFVSKEFGVTPNSYNCTDNSFVHLDKESGVAYVFDADGETIAVIEDGISEVLSLSEYADYIVYQTGVYEYKYDETLGNISTDTRQTYIYDSDERTNVVALEKGVSAYFTDENSRYMTISHFDEDDFFGGIAEYWLFDSEKGEIVLDECQNISVYKIDGKDYITACSKNQAVLYDGDLKPIIKRYFE